MFRCCWWTSQFESDYQNYINQTKNNNYEEQFEQFNTYNNLNKTKKSDYDEYLSTIKDFKLNFYIKIYSEIILIVVDFLMIVFIISAECGTKIIHACCFCCLSRGIDCFTGCVKCFTEGSLLNPLTMQSIISLFLFIFNIFLVSRINKAKSLYNKLIEKIKQNNSKNNINDNIIRIVDPASDLYSCKTGLILFMIFYLLLVIVTIVYIILKKVYFSKKLDLPTTVTENQTDTPTNNSKSEMKWY